MVSFLQQIHNQIGIPFRNHTAKSFSLGLLLFLAGISFAHSQPIDSADPKPESWIFEEASEKVEGLGVATYSRFNPEKSWDEALENAVNDLNANHSMIVSHYGYQIGMGPLRLRSDFAIRTFWDTTQVAVVDSARWQGQAFIRVKPPDPLPDSVLYPNGEMSSVENEMTKTGTSDKWLISEGSTPMINSNWHMSITKAKQDALRKLAEDLSIKVTKEVYSKTAPSSQYQQFSTLYAFQRIRVLKRTFGQDSMKVQVAVHPQEVKMLMDE